MFGLEMFGAVRRWQAREQVRNQLAAMDDRQLADIGLSRGDIEAVAEGKMVRRPNEA